MKFKYGLRRRAEEYEPELVKWWKENGIFERSVRQRPAENAYVFYDGPPFITGVPHHGTLLSSIVKDAVPRYWTMKGKRVERRWGWDCHGLPAENFVEKQLGITDRRGIGTTVSLEEYITKARESMVANSEAWEGVIDRVGRWVDFKGAYRTMDKDFMESVWWAFSELYKKGKIYEGEKVLMYDTKFATPVSKNEVTMDNDAYQTATDPSVYVKFKLKAASAKKIGCDGDVYLLAWTTTPWTLPGNTGVAVNPEMGYSLVKVEGEYYILAHDLVPKVFDGLDYEIVAADISGSSLVSEEYEPLFNFAEKLEDKIYQVWAADYVEDKEGTGIVHLAPAYGEIDFELAQKSGIPVRHVLDDEGYYYPEVAEELHEIGVRDTDERGIEVWEANKFIAKCLEERGVVWKIEYIRHEYPFNPRSKQRIMYRAVPSWFFDIQNQKAEMLDRNGDVNWFPEYLKNGRFAKNIDAAPDWNLSRDRFWATPMPVWKGDRGGVKVVGSYAELEKLSGKRLKDYHRPWVDEIEFEIEGEKFTRIDKVLDCWFESGSMPFAQFHYPFENKEKFEANFPGDFVAEYVGQVRAWFYYVHAVSVALFGSEAFRNVITTGVVAGNDGRKMSKSLGNFTDPNVLMNQYSADSLRFLLLSSPLLSGEDFALQDKDVSDVARKLAMIWNVYDFFTMYAEVDDFVFPYSSASSDAFLVRRMPNTAHSDTPDSLNNIGTTKSLQIIVDIEKLANPLDKWIVSRVYQLNETVDKFMGEYNIPDALSAVLPFVDDLSNWYVRRSRRRFWKSEDDADKKQAYRTLHFVLVQLALILAPFTPFLAEELWQKLGGEGSVHLQDWPTAGRVDEIVLKDMEAARGIIEKGLALRMERDDEFGQIKVRQPLNKLRYGGEQLGKFYEQIIEEEVNVKRVEYISPSVSDINYDCDNKMDIGEMYSAPIVMLDKKLTPELKREGLSREVIRVVQSARKKAGLNVDDRIKLHLETSDETLQEAIDDFGEVIATETLSIFIELAKPDYSEIAQVEKKEIQIKLSKV